MLQDGAGTSDGETAAPLFEGLGSISAFLQIWLSNGLLSPESQGCLDRYYQNWRQLKSERVRFWYDNQFIEIDRILSQYKRPRLLEVGVGTGTECLWFALRGADVTGIDPVGYWVRTATERQQVLEADLGRPLGCRIEKASILGFDDAEGFDIIWLEQAFHHLEPRAEVLRKLGALLKPGGAIVFQESNAWNPLLQLYLLKRRGLDLIIEVETEDGPLPFGNERILTPGRLARILQPQGIETQSVRYFSVFPAHRMFDRFFGLEKFLSHWLAVAPFLPLFTHYNLVGRKRNS